MYKSPFFHKMPLKNLFFRPWVSCALLLAFLINSLGPLPLARADDFNLPVPGVMVRLSPRIEPAMLKGIKVHPDNPLKFDFIMDQGDSTAPGGVDLKPEATRLIKYFLASLTIPENDLWVNLSPYEKDRVIPQSFGLTEMGRDLLAEDYMLKQITASLIYPEDAVGKNFWKRIYEEAQKRFGTTDIPVNTFNKVWVVPENAVVYENPQTMTAYVEQARLKVMLEQDYLSLTKHVPVDSRAQGADINKIGSDIVREIVIPELTKEINEDKNFARLRQVYNSLILATWYKKKIKDSILELVYADKRKVAGVGFGRSTNVEAIYRRYLQAFKKGVFNYIKEESSSLNGMPGDAQGTTPRKYFSGGYDLAMHSIITRTDKLDLPEGINERLTEVEGDYVPDNAMNSGGVDTFDKRNSLQEQRKRYSGIIRQIERADKITAITQAAEVTREGVGDLITQLNHTDNLNQILNISAAPVSKFLYSTYKETVFQYGERIVVFRWPGTTSDHLGLKDLNDVLGQEQVNGIIGSIRDSLRQKMAQIGKDEDPQEALARITREISELVTQKLKPLVKIPLVESGRNLFRIDVGVSQLPAQVNEGTQEAALSKVLTVMKAGLAIVMKNTSSAEGEQGGMMFSQQGFIDRIDQWVLLKKKLSALPLWQNYKGTSVLRDDMVKALRKQQGWEGLSPELRTAAGNSGNYRDLQQYFALTGLVDFIKQWQVDFRSAYERSVDIQTLIDNLGKARNDMPTGRVKAEGDLGVLLSQARDIIAKDSKFLDADSELSFFSHASISDKNMGFILVDIINMGGKNFQEFEVLMQQISETRDMERINRLLMTAADPVTVDFQSKVRQLRELVGDRVLSIKMGGDEITVVVNDFQKVTPELLIAIKRLTNGRVFATKGIGSAIENFKDRNSVTIKRNGGDSGFVFTEIAPNWLAWAEKVYSLDKGVQLLKGYEALGKNVVLTEGQMEGEYRTIPYQDHAMFAKNMTPTGGIDLTPPRMNLKTPNSSGMGIKFHLDPAMFEQLRNATGFVPVIINMKPVADIRLFLGAQ